MRERPGPSGRPGARRFIRAKRVTLSNFIIRTHPRANLSRSDRQKLRPEGFYELSLPSKALRTAGMNVEVRRMLSEEIRTFSSTQPPL